VDAFTQFVNGSPWLSGGALVLWVGTLVWVVTGFTNRGWTTAKQRVRQDEQAEALREQLDLERKETISDQKATITDQRVIIGELAPAVAVVKDFFSKAPVRTLKSDGTP